MRYLEGKVALVTGASRGDFTGGFWGRSFDIYI
jgi:hypothetical protein